MYTYQMILYAAMTHANEIKFAFQNKDFKNEQHKINYIMVVISNDMNRIKQKVLDYQREQDKAETYALNAQDLANSNLLHGGQRYVRKTENVIDERLEDLWTTKL